MWNLRGKISLPPSVDTRSVEIVDERRNRENRLLGRKEYRVSALETRFPFSRLNRTDFNKTRAHGFIRADIFARRAEILKRRIA